MANIEKKQNQTDVAVQQNWSEHPFAAMQRRINDLFETFWGGRWEPMRLAETTAAMPKVDLVDQGEMYQMTAELPGLDEKDVSLTLSANADYLTLKGNKKVEREEKAKDYYRKERSEGSFERRIPLPGPVDTKKIDASFKNGVLTVNLAKDGNAAKSREIPIKK